MVKIDILIAEGKVSRINELELERYINFFSESYLDNLEHAKANLISFPRWSIISAYYAMHDISKLLIAKVYFLKVDFEVHATTIKLLEELLRDDEIASMLHEAYDEFISLANDLSFAKKERVKTQYYTGSKYLKEQYLKKSQYFLSNVTEPFIEKILNLLEELK